MTQVGELVDNQKRSVSCELRKSNDRITPSEKIHATQRYEVKCQHVGNLGGTAFNKRPNRLVDLGRFFHTHKA